jgi:hypothetical protein
VDRPQRGLNKSCSCSNVAGLPLRITEAWDGQNGSDLPSTEIQRVDCESPQTTHGSRFWAMTRRWIRKGPGAKFIDEGPGPVVRVRKFNPETGLQACLRATMRSMHMLFTRRQHPRSAAALPVDWCVAGSLTHHVSSLADSSPGGVFVRTSLPKPVGTPIDLCFFTEHGPHNVKGRVRWSQPKRGMGIGFERDSRM